MKDKFSVQFQKSEDVAGAVRDHQISIENWQHVELVTKLHQWVKIFDFEFKLELPSYPVIGFRTIRNAYATYSWSRNELGIKDNVTFNEKELDRDPAVILRTLCHELLHLWQHYHGKPARSNYHNKEFQKKAGECGLIVDKSGCTSGHTEAFIFVLAKYDVHLVPQPTEPKLWGARKRSLKMVKWRCDCTTVRCATNLKARCLKCDTDFWPG